MDGARPVVFLGPSLAPADARAVLDADYRPPVRRGDVYRCLGTGVSTIAIVDGVFHGEPSVWQREILEALDEGIHVFGAASMGALRAAELAPHGMIGHGAIFEWYRAGVLDGDDEVALLFGPADTGYRPLSEPLVNIRATLARAVAEDVLSPAQAGTLLEHARGRFYPDRSYRDLLACPAVAAWPAAATRALADFLARRPVDLKREDALGLLRHLAAHPRPRRGMPRRAGRLALRERVRHREVPAPGGRRVGDEVLEALERPGVRARLAPVLHRRWFLGAWAAERGQRCPPGALVAFARDFERREGIEDRAAWLAGRGLTESDFLQWLEEEGRAAWLRAAGAAPFGLRPDEEDPDAPFIADWAAAFGITHPAGGPLVPWLVEQGPAAFGFRVESVAALLREAQMTGDLAGLFAAEEAGP